MIRQFKERRMKKLAVLLVCLAISGTAFAEGVDKVVCKDKLDKKGMVIKDKKGNTVQVCKTIKVHKKLDGTTIPSK